MCRPIGSAFANPARSLHELIEAVVVPETWFFRDTEAFRALARIAQAEWLPAESAGVLRLLSLPCSTGEEPYSMAMALIEAGLPGRRFRVDALDISSRALARAQRAVYGTNSFRGIDLGFRDRHFEATPDGYRLAGAVRQQVRFQQGNFFDEGLLPGENLHHIIFCRNVLIYFDRATQDRALKVLARLLAPTGYLFVGPSETGVLLAHDFAPVRIPMAFAFRKVGAASGEPHLHGAQRAPLDRPTAPSARPPTPPRPVPRPGTRAPSQSTPCAARHAGGRPR
jgi:chemotaxis protein methyltransferase WspC